MKGHFVTFVLCLKYWTFLAPLTDESVIEHTIHENVDQGIKLTYELKRIKVPKLLAYKKFKRICIQNDFPLQHYSCVQFALMKTLHLALGSKLPHEIKK